MRRCQVRKNDCRNSRREMFNRPNSNDTVAIVADFIELQSLLSEAPVSAYSLRSLFSMPDDEIDNEGVESSDDLSVNAVEDGIKECKQRAESCSVYPFEVSANSVSLHSAESSNKEVYQFMLLATRLDMKSESRHGGHDATKLFEELCAEVASEYFGHHSKSFVFGTADGGSFKDKVERVINSLHLTSSFKIPMGSTGRQKDAAVDVVAWIPFMDNKDSQMIALGQCKTGTHWEGMLTDTQPNVFFGSFFTAEPFADVGRMFFMTESYGKDRWEERSRRAGIIFDRTRIMEFLPPAVDEDLLNRIREWNRAALAFAEQNM